MKNKPIPEQINYQTKIFGWAAAGFIVSGFIAFKLWQNYYFVQKITENYVVLAFLVLVFLGFVVWISMNLDKWDSNKIMLIFFVYSILNGIILPLIFQFFTQNFFLSTFFILAGMFGGMTVIGYFFKQNLTSLRNLILMFVLGIILNILLNFVWRNDNFQLISSAIAVLVLVGITAYDSKRTKEYNEKFEPQKATLIGAFALSLNLYYLFIVLVLEANKGNRRGDV